MNVDNLPTPIESLSDLLDTGDVTEKAFKVFVGHNLGHRVFLLQVPMHEFFQMSEVANDPSIHGETVSQRKLDPAHAAKLAVYILKGLVVGAIEQRNEKKLPPSAALTTIRERMGRQPYLALQPLVANIRACKPAGDGIRGRRLLSKEEVTAGFEVFLSQKHVLWVVDGQHRRQGMKLVFEFLEQVSRTQMYPKKGSLSLFAPDTPEVSAEFASAWQEVHAAARTFCKVSVEVHLGLETSQERQLFHDLNNLGKRVDKNLALTFDNSNPVNLFIKDVLHEGIGLNIVEKDAKEWKDDEGTIAWKDVVAVNAILFLNKTNIGGASPASVNEKGDIAKRFWEGVNAIQGFGEPRAKEVTVAAQPVVLKALAKLVYDFGFSNRRPANGDEMLDTLLSSIADIDFSHENPMWQYYNLTDEQRAAHGLGDLGSFLPSSETGNRDIGSFQEGVMRFGAKHNDIFPIIGDMIRWKLGFPNRHG